MINSFLIRVTLTGLGVFSGNYQSSIASISWIGNSNQTNYSMTMSGISTRNYFAFGLSNDQLMVSKINFIFSSLNMYVSKTI